VMVQYLAAFRNEKGHPPVAQLFSDDEEGAIRAFVAKHDRPGFAVYRCVSALKAGASRRCLETVARVEQLAVDIDFNDLEESPDEVETKLLHLPCSQQRCARAAAACTLSLRSRRRSRPDLRNSAKCAICSSG
jgi:hypothetical protein